jgi:3-hydroxyisobutyrate dehydrogenase
MSTNKPRIAFFGLGTMGTGMARRLLNAGYDLAVYNRNRSRAEALGGGTIADSPAQAAEGRDILIAMLADDPASRTVWLGDSATPGAFSSAKKGAIAIDCSTLTVAWVRELAAAAQKCGVHFLDTPVTGTKPHAAAGELTILVGGDAAILEQVRPVLAPMSKEIVYLGPTGAGAALKLINNFMCGVQAVALAEANALLHREGLDAQKALPILLNGAPGSPLVKVLAGRHANRDYTPNFQLKLLAKDLSYAIAEGRDRGVDLATASAALGLLNKAAGSGLAEQDMSSVIKFLEEPPR